MIFMQRKIPTSFLHLCPIGSCLFSCAVLFPPGSTSLTFSDMKEVASMVFEPATSTLKLELVQRNSSGIVPGIGHCNRWDEDLCITLVLQGSRITTPGVKHKDITMTLQNLRGNSHIHSFYLQAPNVSRCAVTFAPCSVFNFPSRGWWLFPAQTTHLPQIVEKFSLSDQFRRHCPDIMRKVSRARSSNHPL